MEQILAQARPSGNTIPLVVLVVYLALLLGLGLMGYLRSQIGEDDYYLASRRQGWLVSSLTIMATFFSSFALLGAPGKVYSEGVIFALFALNVPLSGVCVWILGHRISRRGRQRGYVTPGDMIADHYGGHGLRILVALTCILYVVPYVVIQIQAGGLLFDTLFPEPVLAGTSNFTAGAILLAAITTVYVMVGGMRSVAWTDVLQGLMLISGMLLGGLVVVTALGGAEGFSRGLASLPRSHLTAPGATGTWTPVFLLSVCLFGSTGTMVSPAQWMRYYAADSPRTLRRAALIFSLVLTACFLFGVMLVGLGGKALYPEGLDGAGNSFRPDQILVVVLHEQLPSIWPVAGLLLSSVIIMAIAAASMSTADSNLHALSAILTRDIYDRYLRPSASERERTWVGRVIIFLATVVALVLVIGGHAPAGAPGDELSFLARSMLFIADVALVAISFSTQLLPVAVDMLWIRRGSRAGATLGLLTGLLVTAYFDPALYTPGVAGLLPGLGATLDGAIAGLKGLEILGVRISLLSGVWGLAANGLVFAVASLITRRARGRGGLAAGSPQESPASER